MKFFFYFIFVIKILLRIQKEFTWCHNFLVLFQIPKEIKENSLKQKRILLSLFLIHYTNCHKEFKK